MATSSIGRGEGTPAAAERRVRLEQLLDLALAYRSCTRKELARRLRRDPTKLVPGTGIPKLDVVVGLAGVLDWPVGDVVRHLSPAPPDGAAANGRTDDRPTVPGRRAAAARLRDARALRADGRYLDVIAVATRGLAEIGTPSALRRALQVALGDAYYALGSLVEARAIARDLQASWRRGDPSGFEDRHHQAFAHFLGGQARRALIAVEPARVRPLARAARRELERSLALYRRLALDRHDPAAEGMAHHCLGAMLEVDAALGRLRPVEVVARIAASLERTRHADQVAPPLLESYGWWCIYGCQVALRHLTEDEELEHAMAVFTNKADEIANAVDSWPLRERVFTVQFLSGGRAADAARPEMPRVIDFEDVRVIAGTMGRFPAFRDHGWRILETAQIVRPR